VTFASDDYQIVLQADLDEDMYKLVVTEYWFRRRIKNEQCKRNYFWWN
jgi:hypothetical protein